MYRIEERCIMQQFFYRFLEDGTYCVTEYQGDEADVIIPDTYCSKPVTVLFDRLFKGHTEITSVKIPDTITDIGSFVFDGCTSLKHIELPPSLINMWDSAFARSSIEEIVLPDKITSIVPFTFKDCKELKRVVCNPGLKKIHAWAFHGCSNLKDFQCSEDTVVSEDAFKEGELIGYGGKRSK